MTSKHELETYHHSDIIMNINKEPKTNLIDYLISTDAMGFFLSFSLFSMPFKSHEKKASYLSIHIHHFHFRFFFFRFHNPKIQYLHCPAFRSVNMIYDVRKVGKQVGAYL